MRDGFLRLIVIDGGYDDDFFRVADALLADGGEFLDVGASLRPAQLRAWRQGTGRARELPPVRGQIPRLLRGDREDAGTSIRTCAPEVNAAAVTDYDGQ